MAQSLGKKVARIFSVLVAALLICSAAFLFTACETDHPEIKMTIEFNDKSYELTYKLYRNMYPKTVAHYLELIDMDFYDNTVIHDYSTSSSDGKGQGFYGGGYYMQEDNADRMAELDYEKATMTNDSVTLKNISVWKDTAQNEPLNTLYGEFSANGFKVANNGLTHKKGSLATHYNSVSDANGKKVAVKSNKLGVVEREYKYNSTTSLFFISSSSNSSLDANYCTFGYLADSKNEDKFQELLDAIKDFSADKTEADSEYSFTEEQDYDIEGNEYTGQTEVKYNVPKEEGRITIKKVEVLKY